MRMPTKTTTAIVHPTRYLVFPAPFEVVPSIASPFFNKLQYRDAPDKKK
jgi:hypothetical protein